MKTLAGKLFAVFLAVMVLTLIVSGVATGALLWFSAGHDRETSLTALSQQLTDEYQNLAWNEANQQSIRQELTRLDTARDAQLTFLNRTALEHPSATITAVATPSQIQQVLQGHAVVVTHWFAILGKLGPVVAVPVSQQGVMQGAVVLLYPQTRVRQTAQDILLFIIAGAACATIIVGMVSMVLARHLTRPLKRLQVAAQAMGDGAFATRVPPSGRDEIGQLILSFNAMAARLDGLEQARKDLLAHISHEIKGPLARVVGYVSALQDNLGDAEARAGYLGIVSREVWRVNYLVEDVLDLTKLEAGRLTLHIISCDLAAPLTQALEPFLAVAATAHVEIIASISPTLPVTRCDPRRVEQMVVNLVQNALAHTPPGGTIWVTATHDSAAVTVSVRDTGLGIDPSLQDRVWEPFFKADPARTPRDSGSGLGLAIVRQLARAQGGTVWLHSSAGKGTTVGFCLPLEKSRMPPSR